MCRIENQRPNCQCALGFSFTDPNDSFGDCKPNLVQNCVGDEKGSGEDLYELIEVTDTDWPLTDYEQINPSTEEECRSACLGDCFCGVTIYRSNSCWKKMAPLSNGIFDANLSAKAFMKFRKDNILLVTPTPNPDEPRRDQKLLMLVGSAVLGNSVFINVFLVSVAFLGFFLIRNRRLQVLNSVNYASEATLRCFRYKELVRATNGFKDEIGRGASGIVYKGVIASSSITIVAVKKLDGVAQDSEKEFRT